MREKLIDLITYTFNKQFYERKSFNAGIAADYLLENGIVAPLVEVGQIVWYIRGGYYNSVHKKPCPITVTEINKKLQHRKIEWGFIANGTRYRFSSIGKSVFLTREEAEQALKERVNLET